MRYFFGGFLLAFWLLIFIAFSWSDKYKPFINILYGLLSFVVIGAFYLVPAWLIFYVK